MSIFDHADDGGGSAIDVGDIKNSLRFRKSFGNQPYLVKPGVVVPGNLYRVVNLSAWVKPSFQASARVVHSSIYATNYRFLFYFDQSIGALGIYGMYNGTLQYDLVSAAAFRDPNAWYHIEAYIDTNQAVATDRIKLFVNGVRIQSWMSGRGNFPAQNGYGWILDPSLQVRVGVDSEAPNFFDGYIARACLVDGVVLPEGSFGRRNPQTGQWITKTKAEVKAVVDSGLANSFMLEFDNGTSLTTLGYDTSAKGNNFTASGFVLTAGNSYDWMTDSPGANYATFNSLATHSTYQPHTGNLGYSSISGSWLCSPATQAIVYPAYAEFSWQAGGDGNVIRGIVNIERSLRTINSYPGSHGDSYGYFGLNGNKITGGVATATGVTSGAGDIIGVAYNPNTGNLWVSKNGVWIGGGDPALGMSPLFTVVNPNLRYTFATGLQSTSDYANFGQKPFAYTPPTGFKALCAQNLPEPAIMLPSKHFDTVLALGSQLQSAIGALGFDDYRWVKNRVDGGTGHVHWDVARGYPKRLDSTSSGPQLNFTYAQLVQANAHAAWVWKANGAPVSNTKGTVTSQVSVNVEAGFSVSKFNAGAAGNKTVGHGLPKAPDFWFVKDAIAAAGNFNWYVGCRKGLIPSQWLMYLNLTNTAINNSRIWANAAPTADVLSFESGYTVGANNDDSMLFAMTEIPGFSKVFVFTADGINDGSFLHCGFRPAFMMMKNTGVGSDWWIWDSRRTTANPMLSVMYANLPNAEYTDTSTFAADFVSNGVKMRSSNSTVQGAGSEYVAILFAESPFKYSNAR